MGWPRVLKYVRKAPVGVSVVTRPSTLPSPPGPGVPIKLMKLMVKESAPVAAKAPLIVSAWATATPVKAKAEKRTRCLIIIGLQRGGWWFEQLPRTGYEQVTC